ncbi:MAG TPA: response regulator [Chryseosolibacter sp.]|nr:response regulator [Chryseosolibacter sp.]
MNILLVEDDPVSQKIASQMLGKWGYNVTSANDGVEALQVVSETIFELILMDINMPVLDGFETTTMMRSRSGTYLEHVPILAYTASSLADTKEKALRHGMNDIVGKPVNPPELHCKIGEHLLASRVDARPMRIRFDLFTDTNPDFKFELISLMIKNLREVGFASYKAFYGNESRTFASAAHKVKSTLMLLDDQELSIMVSDLKVCFESSMRAEALQPKILRFNLLSESIIKTLAAEINAYSESQAR